MVRARSCAIRQVRLDGVVKAVMQAEVGSTLWHLQNNQIRYWTEENKDGECYSGRLITWDEYGILVEDSAPSAPSTHFIPWSRLRNTIQSVRADQDWAKSTGG